MKKCVCCGRETYHRFELYVVCYQCEIDGSFDYHLKQGSRPTPRAPDVLSPVHCCAGFVFNDEHDEDCPAESHASKA